MRALTSEGIETPNAQVIIREHRPTPAERRTREPIAGMETIVTAFPIHTIDTAPDGSKATLKHVKETLGGVPNLAAGMAGAPTLVRAFFAVREIYAQGTLSGAEIQVLSLANAYENDCEWCVAFHTAMAHKEGVSKDAIDDLRAGRTPRDSRFAALSNLSRTMIKNRGNVGEQDLNAFVTAGFTSAQALEVVVGVGFSVLANFAGHLIHAPLDAMFEPFAWKKPARMVNSGQPVSL